MNFDQDIYRGTSIFSAAVRIGTREILPNPHRATPASRGVERTLTVHFTREIFLESRDAREAALAFGCILDENQRQLYLSTGG